MTLDPEFVRNLAQGVRVRPYVARDPKLPSVLLVGDSIMLDYVTPLREVLLGRVNLFCVPENGRSTREARSRIEGWLTGTDGWMRGTEGWLRTAPWDLILFNWGLHDLRLDDPGAHGIAAAQVPLEEYRGHLAALTALVRAAARQALWATTTPVPFGAKLRRRGDEVVYNSAAAGVMSDAGIPTVDLWSFVAANRWSLQRHCDVHFTSAGNLELARLVADRIKELLGLA